MPCNVATIVYVAYERWFKKGNYKLITETFRAYLGICKKGLTFRGNMIEFTLHALSELIGKPLFVWVLGIKWAFQGSIFAILIRLIVPKFFV